MFIGLLFHLVNGSFIVEFVVFLREFRNYLYIYARLFYIVWASDNIFRDYLQVIICDNRLQNSLLFQNKHLTKISTKIKDMVLFGD